jgi:hypothetical protein
MTVKIDIQSNIKEVQKKLNMFQKKHLPEASADAINEVGVKAVNAMRSQIAKKLDRPTMFTKKGVVLKYKARRNDLSALIEVPPIQSKYLEKQFEGGIETAKNQQIPVPYDKGVLNQYGNIRGKRRGFAKRKTEFIGQVKGIDGVWRRTGGKKNPQLKLIIGFEKVVRYTKKLEFFKTVSGVVNKNIDKILNKHIQRIIGR